MKYSPTVRVAPLCEPHTAHRRKMSSGQPGGRGGRGARGASAAAQALSPNQQGTEGGPTSSTIDSMSHADLKLEFAKLQVKLESVEQEKTSAVQRVAEREREVTEERAARDRAVAEERERAVAEERAARERAVAEERAARERAVAEERAARERAAAARERAVAEERQAWQNEVAAERARVDALHNEDRTAFRDTITQFSQALDRAVQAATRANTTNAPEDLRRAQELGRDLTSFVLTLLRRYNLDTVLLMIEERFRKSFIIEPNASLHAQGSTSVSGDLPIMREWDDFLATTDPIKERFGSPLPRIPSEEELGILTVPSSLDAPINATDEADVARVWEQYILKPLAVIFQIFQATDYLGNSYTLGTDVVFKDRARELAQQPSSRPSSHAFRPDRYCAFKKRNDTAESIAFVVEYKSAHKFPVDNVRQMLTQVRQASEEERMATLSSSETGLADAILQVYNYMVHGKVAYGCLVTGTFIIFLKRGQIGRREALFYHLAIPEQDGRSVFNRFRFATSTQMLAFMVLAVNHAATEQQGAPSDAPPSGGPGSGSRPRSAGNTSSRTPRRTVQRLHLEDATRRDRSSRAQSEGRILRPLRNQPQNRQGNSHNYPPESYTGATVVGNSPCRNAESAETDHCPTDDRGIVRRVEDTSDHDIGIVSSPFRASVAASDSDSSSGSDSIRNQLTPSTVIGSSSLEAIALERPYCTQRCLLGLLTGDVFDNECPNVGHHRAKSRDDCHPVGDGKWLELLREQLAGDFHTGVMPLDKEGAVGVAFRVTLLSHGYTFVGKGTEPRCAEYLEHEAKVYEHLRPLQGLYVPVFLGRLEFNFPKDRDIHGRERNLTSMLLVSWCGRTLFEVKDIIDKKEAKNSLLQALSAIHAHGVAHADVRDANVLWTEEGGSGHAVVIDFERSMLHGSPVQRTWIRAPQKRRWSISSPEIGRVDEESSEISSTMRDDIAKASGLFL